MLAGAGLFTVFRAGALEPLDIMQGGTEFQSYFVFAHCLNTRENQVFQCLDSDHSFRFEVFVSETQFHRMVFFKVFVEFR